MDNVSTTNTNIASGGGISGYALKMIAVISMFIDHLGATVVLGCLYAARSVTVAMTESERLLDQLLVWVNHNWNQAVSIYEYMRYIGRIAFPIYCFLIVEGFLHTKNVKKYALRLGLFALISEIPFDLAFNEGWWDMTSNNVYFTLLIGLLVIWGISAVGKRCEEETKDQGEQEEQQKKDYGILCKICGILGILVCIIGGAFVADYMGTDYAAAGVFTIVVMYLLRRKPWMGYIMGILVLTVVLIIEMNNSTELIALIGAVPVCYYNGKRGKNVKYFFYAFYPVHLLLLWFVTYLLGF